MQARNDHARFAEVFLPYLVDAYRLARWLTGSRADAEDIVQDAAIRAFQGIGRFAGVNPRAWVLSIVRNTTYSWLAKNRPAALVLTGDLDDPERDRTAPSAAEGEPAETPETVLIAKIEAEEARQRLAALPPPFREVLVLREIHQLSYHEIAAVVDVPVGTVMSRLARARRMVIATIGSGDR